MALDLHEALETTLAREETAMRLFREYRQVTDRMDRVQMEHIEDLSKLLSMAREHIVALVSGESHIQWTHQGRLSDLCVGCGHAWPCDSVRAKSFLDRLDLEAL